MARKNNKNKRNINNSNNINNSSGSVANKEISTTNTSSSIDISISSSSSSISTSTFDDTITTTSLDDSGVVDTQKTFTVISDQKDPSVNQDIVADGIPVLEVNQQKVEEIIHHENEIEQPLQSQPTTIHNDNNHQHQNNNNITLKSIYDLLLNLNDKVSNNQNNSGSSSQGKQQLNSSRTSLSTSSLLNNNEPLQVDWKSMYLLLQKEYSLEKKKVEVMEVQIVDLEQEKKLLNDRIKILENHLENEKTKLHKTFGTIRSGTVRLLNNNNQNQNNTNGGAGNNLASLFENDKEGKQHTSLSTILKDLQNIESIDNDNNVLNSKLGENADALLTKLNSFGSNTQSSAQDELNGSNGIISDNSSPSTSTFTSNDTTATKINLGNGTSTIRLSKAEGDETSEAYLEKSKLEKIIKIQSYVRRWLARKSFKKLKTKKSAVKELFETEVTYCDHISNLLRIFYNPLRQKIQSGEIQLEVGEVERIFSTINTISMSNSIFLKQTDDIHKSFNRWSLIGTRMLEQLPLFESYIDYIVNYETSLATLKRSLQIPSFAQFVKAAENHADLDGLDLADLLIMPIQRVPRYVMLISAIKKYTSSNHSDYMHLSKALDAFRKFADGINDRKGKRQNCIALDEKILGLKEPISVKSNRYLIREGSLKYKKSMEHVFLFNDLLVVCHPVYKKVKQQRSSSMGSTSNNISINSSTSSTSSQNVLDQSSSSSSSNSSSSNHNVEVTYKFIAKYNLDARVKIVEDSNEPKWLTIVPDLYSIELLAPSTEERQFWVRDLMTIVSLFADKLLNGS